MAPEGRWNEIIGAWGRYIRANPGNAEAHFQRSGAWYHKGDLDSTRRDAEQACELGLAQACSAASRLR